jgi:hypothetical protein
LIRDLMVDLKTLQNYQGVTGPIELDQSWNNVRNIYMAEVRNGKFVFSAAPKLNLKSTGSKTGNY